MEHDFDECDFPEGKFSHHFYHTAPGVLLGTRHLFSIQPLKEKKYLIEFSGSNCFRVEFCKSRHILSSVVFRLEVNAIDKNEKYTEVIISSKKGKTTNHKSAFIEKESKIQLFIHTTGKKYEVTIDKNPPIIYETESDDYASDIHISGSIAVCSFHDYRNEIPYRLDLSIPDNFQIGDIFTFRGKAPTNGKAFAIDFWNGSGLEGADVWFRFIPYFDWHGKNYIALNTYIDGEWQTEISGKGMPLKAEQPYKIDILVEREHFRCWVNDVDFCTYKHVHYTPVKWVQDIRVYFPYDESDDNVGITSVVMTRVNRHGPSEFGFQNARTIAESDPTSVIYFPRIPAKINFPITLEPGSCICISGVFKRAAQKFKCAIEGEKSNIIYEMEADFSKRTITPFNNYDVPDPSSKPNVGLESEIQPIFPAKIFGEQPAIVAETLVSLDRAFTPKPSKDRPTYERPLFQSKFSAAPPFPFKADGQFDMMILCCDGLLHFFVDDKFFYRSQPNDNYRLAKSILFNGDVKIKIVAFLKADPIWVYRLRDKLPKKGHMYYDH